MVQQYFLASFVPIFVLLQSHSIQLQNTNVTELDKTIIKDIYFKRNMFDLCVRYLLKHFRNRDKLFDTVFRAINLIWNRSDHKKTRINHTLVNDFGQYEQSM